MKILNLDSNLFFCTINLIASFVFVLLHMFAEFHIASALPNFILAMCYLISYFKEKYRKSKINERLEEIGGELDG